MGRDNLAVGLDIGSSKIAICVAQENEGKLQITALTAVPFTGLRRGVVVDTEETVSAISQVLEDAERMAGTSITHAVVSINGSHIEAIPAKGVIAISKPNGIIDATDVERAIDSAKTIALPQNRELLHTFPRTFIVDGQDEIRDPVGMAGIRLEADTLIVSGNSSAIRNLTRTVYQAGLEIDSLVFNPLASAKLITSRMQRESGVVIADMGAASTSLAVYEEGELLHCASIPIGSNYITNDIAIGLRTSLDVAEKIKIKHGTAMPSTVRDSESIILANFDPAENEKVSKKQLAEIIEARVVEIFNLINEELSKIDKEGVLPAGIVFTGGGSMLEGLVDKAKQTLRIPAQVGYPQVPLSGMVDKLDNPIYITSVGLIQVGMEGERGEAPWRLDMQKLGGVFDRFRGLFKHFTN